jgi:hypothetical protein
MAYAFAKTVDQVTGGQDPDKIDVFGGGGGSVFQQPGADVQAATTKTSTAGDLGEAGGSGGGGGEGAAEMKEPAAPDQSKALEANIGKTQAPAAIQGIRGQVKAGQEGLQQAADEYTKAYKTEYNRALDKSELDKALQGGGEATKKVSSDLAKTSAGPVKGFEGASDYGVSDVKYLQNDAGLKHLASRGQDPRYSSGMAAFDVMLMNKDKNFQNLVNQVRGEASALEQTIQETPDTLREAAQTYADTSLSDWQKGARDYIGAAKADTMAENVRDAEQYITNVAANNLLPEAQKQAEAERQAMENEIVARFGERGLKQFRDTYGSTNFGDYIRAADTSGIDYRSMLDEDEATLLNQAAYLLGEGGQAYGAAGDLGPDFEFDADRLWADIMGGTGAARRKADEAGETRMDEILGAAQTRADEEDAAIAGMAGEGYSQILDEAVRGFAGDIPLINEPDWRGMDDPEMIDMSRLTPGTDEYFQAQEHNRMVADFVPEERPERRDRTGETWLDYYDPSMLEGFTGGSLAESNPALASQDLVDLDMLTQEEADELNAIAADIGVRGGYQAGGGGLAKENLVNEDALRRYLEPLIKAKMAERDKAWEAERAGAAAAPDIENVLAQGVDGIMGGSGWNPNPTPDTEPLRPFSSAAGRRWVERNKPIADRLAEEKRQREWNAILSQNQGGIY